MNSLTGRDDSKKQSQLEIKRQIALLQARLEPEDLSVPAPRSPKRKAAPVVLAPATPSPKKKRRLDVPKVAPISQPNFGSISQPRHIPSKPSKTKQQPVLAPVASTFISKLADVAKIRDDVEALEPVARSTTFQQKAVELSLPPERTTLRDDRLAIIEELEPGPYNHEPPSDDPKFERLEPHSGIRLVQRSLAHDDLCEYMRGRYYISPSRLYSCARLEADKRSYDIPVAGDWITIAVVAERGPVRTTRAPVPIEKEEDDEEAGSSSTRWKPKPPPEDKPAGKKFITLKLVDFGARSRSSSATGGISVIRGDAFLNLLLFESDSCDRILHDGQKEQLVYRGGSRGAFETLTKVREGDVIALLNPRILKPYQRANDAPHQVSNIFGITPESAASVIVLGRSKDLGTCTVRKKDGGFCNSWYDRRVSDVCEFHVHAAVQHRRASRPEFTASTGTLSNTAKHKAKHAYDPAKLWGLKPDERKDSTYVIAGHVVSGSANDPRTLHLSENIGREGQAKAKRKLNRDADLQLRKMLEKDKDGMRVVMTARVAARKMAAKEKPGLSAKARGKQKEQPKGATLGDGDVSDDDEGGSGQDSDDDLVVEEPKKTTKGYSANVIKSLGFDPTLKGGAQKIDNVKLQAKLRELESVRTSRKSIELGARPGPKIWSGVKAPERGPNNSAKTSRDQDQKMVDLDDSD